MKQRLNANIEGKERFLELPGSQETILNVENLQTQNINAPYDNSSRLLPTLDELPKPRKSATENINCIIPEICYNDLGRSQTEININEQIYLEDPEPDPNKCFFGLLDKRSGILINFIKLFFMVLLLPFVLVYYGIKLIITYVVVPLFEKFQYLGNRLANFFCDVI